MVEPLPQLHARRRAARRCRRRGGRRWRRLAETSSGASRRRCRLHGERLDKALVAMAAEFSRSHLQAPDRATATCGRRSGRARRRRARCGRPARRGRAGADRTRAAPSAPRRCRSTSSTRTSTCWCVDKPAGLVVHPAAGNWSGTLLNGLLAHDPGAATLPRAGIVHRLDKDTSGLMVVGKTLAGGDRADARDRRARGAAASTWRSCTARSRAGRIQRRGADRPRSAVARAHGGGRRRQAGAHRCRAVARRRRRLGALRCTLHTGRTHQIRVHLAFARPSAGGRRALRRPAGARHDAPGAARGAARLRAPDQRRRRCASRRAPPADFAPAWRQLTDATTVD